MTRGKIIRNVEIAGRELTDIRVCDGRIAQIGVGLKGEEMIDARGAAIIPGLADHHIHLLSLAAHFESVVLEGARDACELGGRLRAACAAAPPGAWIRATGYHERIAGDLDRFELDRLAPHHRLRVQHQSGALWMLNSAALEILLDDAMPDCVERDAKGVPTGRIWRGDAWLGARIGQSKPDLARVGAALASFGVTAVTDATAATDTSAARLLAGAHRNGHLPQRLRLMSAGELAPDSAYAIGEVKILLDEHALPDFDDLCARFAQALAWGRAPAIHCVTAAELAFTLAALEASGNPAGARIEHGSIIPGEAIDRLKSIGASIVTQPVLVADRGDRYLAETAQDEHGDLYRLQTLIDAGVCVAGSSDAPYGAPDPWRAIAAAVSRKTQAGARVAPNEAVTPAQALALFLGRPEDTSTLRTIELGADADLCILKAPLADVLHSPSAGAVAATMIGGEVVHQA